MKSLRIMTVAEMEEYYKQRGLFFSASLTWLNEDGRPVPSDHDCVSRAELNETIREMRREKNVVFVRRFIRYMGGRYTHCKCQKCGWHGAKMQTIFNPASCPKCYEHVAPAYKNGVQNIDVEY